MPSIWFRPRRRVRENENRQQQEDDLTVEKFRCPLYACHGSSASDSKSALLRIELPYEGGDREGLKKGVSMFVGGARV